MNPAVKSNKHFAHPLLLIECEHRCFCNWQVEDRTKQPSGAGMEEPAHPIEKPRKVISLDGAPDFSSPSHNNYPTDYGDDLAMHIYNAYQAIPQGYMSQYPLPFTSYSLDAANKIECRGDRLPSFPLPGPYTFRDFRTNQELCAVANSGGFL